MRARRKKYKPEFINFMDTLSKRFGFNMITTVLLYSSSYSYTDTSVFIHKEEDVPIRPIWQTVIGPSLLICGIIITGLGISSMVENNKNKDANGTFVGPIILAGKLLTISGASISIGGGIVTISAISKWQKHKRYKSEKMN